MAFKKGTPIQAGLGRADFSGYERAGQAMGQAYANAGQIIGSSINAAVQNYRIQKEEKQQNEAATAMLQTHFPDLSPDEAKAAVKGMGGGSQAFAGLMALDQQRKEFDRTQAINEARSGLIKDYLQQDEEGVNTFDLAGAAQDPRTALLGDNALDDLRLFGEAINKREELDVPQLGGALEQQEMYIANEDIKDPETGEILAKRGDWADIGTDQDTGDLVFRTPDGRQILMPKGFKPERQFTAADPKDWAAQKGSLLELEQTINRVDEFLAARKEVGTGIEYAKARAGALAKALFNRDDLTNKELSAEVVRKELRAMVGQFKEQVVGGGVMTEEDARRIEDALGGSSLTTAMPAIEKLLNKIRTKAEQTAKSKRSNMESIRSYNPKYASPQYALPASILGSAPQKAEAQVKPPAPAPAPAPAEKPSYQDWVKDPANTMGLEDESLKQQLYYTTFGQ